LQTMLSAAAAISPWGCVGIFRYVFMSEHMQGPLDEWSVAETPEAVLLDVEADCYWWGRRCCCLSWH
jgi:hypothetical protein